LTPTGSEASPAGFTYGVEYSKTQIENELNGITKGFIREQDTYGHGTHVASTAAGNGQASNFKYIGMAPESDIIVVKGGNGNFTTDNEIDGLTYAQNKAAALHEPIVVNMSFGGQIGSHDGTDPDEVAINNFVQSAGHVVCVAAGNDGSNAIHINGTLISGSTATYTITVPSYTPTTPVGQENNYFVLDLWLQNTNSISATVTSPSNIVFSSQLNNDVTSPNQADGTIDLYDEIDPQNEHRHLQLSVYDGTSAIPKAGTWTITFSTTASSTPYNAWLESSLNNASAAISNGNTNETVGIPGTSAGAITVASYVTKWFWTDYTGESWQNGPTDRTGNISTFSSIGPTADNRQKPDIAAPGQGIVAAFSSMDSSESTSSVIVKNEYLFMQGTSMACPHVTGASALLLSVKPTITAAQVKNYLNSNTTIDSYTSTVWNADWGNGKMNIYKAMASAVGGIGSNQVTLMYNSDTISYYTILPATNQKVAMRFTPTISGNLSSISIEFNSGTSSVAGTGNLIISAAQSIAGSIDGIPGTQIGNSVSVPISSLTQGTVNVIDMTSSNVPVTAGTDFQIVLGTTNSTDSLQLLLDNGSFQIDRTSSYRTGANGVLGWYNRADPNYTKSYTPAYNNLMISAKIASLVTGVQKEGSNVPSSFALEQNYPNPFNPSTKINYQLAAKTQVSLKVYDVLGREVATLIDREQPAGQYQTQWDAKQYSSGIYFITMQTNSYSKTIKMVLLK
ncbi:MAG TPA: S8 family serine peptidase, partial [Bacteroidota bacterium]|nr:S8 family serine peptidase [Bacteroidota bacterium]